jgi:hypothetical protein
MDFLITGVNINKIKKTKCPEVFQTNSKPYRESYLKWIEKWWQWAFHTPKDQNPITDKTGEYSGIGQNGPVWYLAGTTGNTSHAQRNCVIPHGKSILFPIIVSQFSRSEKPTMSDQELIRYTAKDIDQTSFLEAIVDDITLTGLSRFRIRNWIHLDIVAGNIWDVKSGPTKAVSDGFWVFLKPLDDGKHTIRFHGVEPNFETSVTYNIIMR